ncbi:MAG: GldG family protein [Planctomycetota bacterium]|nr:GldG family protein [Planctomycetota bacterium]
MEVNAPPEGRAPGQGTRPVSTAVKLFRLIGSFCCFGIMVNLFVSMARDSFFDEYALVPGIAMATALALAIFVCREEFLETIRSPRFKVMVNGLVQGAIALVILMALLYAFGYRFYTRFDFTTDKLNRLAGESLKTLELLREAPEGIEAVFIQGEDPAAADPDREKVLGPNGYRARVETILKEYETEAGAVAPGKFRYSVINLLKNPQDADALGKRMGVRTFTSDALEGVVFLSGDKSKLITEADMHGVGFARGVNRKAEFQAERVFTAAMRTLLKPKRKTVAIVQGQGEAPPDDTKQIADLLRRENVDAREIALGAEKLPEDLSAVVIAGPKQAFAPEAIEQLRGHLKRGGSLVLFADPVLPKLPGQAGEPCGLAPLLAEYGIVLRQDYAARGFKPSTLGESIVIPQVPGFPPTGSKSALLVTLAMHKQAMIFTLPCVLQSDQPKQDGYRTEALLVSPPYQSREMMCWADPVTAEKQRTQAEGDSIKGPLTLAMASSIPDPGDQARAEHKGARILVLASSSAALDKTLINYPGNALFLLAALRWAAGEDELVSEIPPRDPQVRVAKLEDGAGRVLSVILVLGLPALAVFLGLIIATSRRN